MVRTLRASLADYPLVLLKAVAEGWRLSLTDERTGEIVSLLAHEMSDQNAVARVVGALGQVERQALGYAAAAGPVKAHVFQRKFGVVRGMGPGRLEWDETWKNPASPAESLWYLGLVQREVSRLGAYHGDVFYVPAEIQAVLPPLPSDSPTFQLETVSEPSMVQDAGDALARDVFLLLTYLRRHDIRSKKEGWSRRAFSEMGRRLSGPPSAERLGLLERVCEKSGLVALVDGVWRPAARAASWLKKSPEARQRQLFDAWRTEPVWNELCRLPGLRCEKTGWRNDPRLARDAVVKHLRECPADTWSTISSFVDSVREVDPDFQRPDGDYDSWYIQDGRTGAYLSGFVHWDAVEGALLRYLLTHPLLWLGLVLLGREASDAAPACFRLTRLGAAVLRLPAAESSPSGAVEAKPARQFLVLRPDSSIIVPAAAEWYDRWLLGRFATWAGSKQGAALYRLDAVALQTSLKEGVTLPQILAFLKRVSGGRVPPQTVEALRSLAGTKT